MNHKDRKDLQKPQIKIFLCDLCVLCGSYHISRRQGTGEPPLVDDLARAAHAEQVVRRQQRQHLRRRPFELATVEAMEKPAQPPILSIFAP